MYTEFGGCPAAGVVVVGKIHRKTCIIVASDATVKVEHGFYDCNKKFASTRILYDKQNTIIYLVDSAEFLILQDQIFQIKSILADNLEIMQKYPPWEYRKYQQYG